MTFKKREPMYSHNSKVERREKAKQSLLSKAYGKSSDVQRDASARMIKLASVHIGNKLVKPYGLWNPKQTKQAMSRLKSGKARLED